MAWERYLLNEFFQHYLEVQDLGKEFHLTSTSHDTMESSTGSQIRHSGFKILSIAQVPRVVTQQGKENAGHD